jgi:hypothetical protein
VPYRPEAEGTFALPEHEFGLDVIALVVRHAPLADVQRAPEQGNQVAHCRVEEHQ